MQDPNESGNGQLHWMASSDTGSRTKIVIRRTTNFSLKSIRLGLIEQLKQEEAK